MGNSCAAVGCAAAGCDKMIVHTRTHTHIYVFATALQDHPPKDLGNFDVVTDGIVSFMEWSHRLRVVLGLVGCLG